MATRYKPEFRSAGTKKWQGFPNAHSFGDQQLAKDFVKHVRRAYKEVGRAGKFRVRKILVGVNP